MKIAVTSLLTLGLVWAMWSHDQQAKTKSSPKAVPSARQVYPSAPKAGSSTVPATEPYDPEHLGPGEVACGRDKPGVPNPCHCVQHRMKESEAKQRLCESEPDKHDRAKCMVANEVCAIVPVDVDHADWNSETGERMPSQCLRSCSKARCECCKS